MKEKFAIRQDPNIPNNWGILWDNHGVEGGFTSEEAARSSAIKQDGVEADPSESRTWDW